MSNKKITGLPNWYNLPEKTKIILDHIVNNVEEYKCLDLKRLRRIRNSLNWFNTPARIKDIIELLQEALYPSPQMYISWQKLPNDVEKLRLLANEFHCDKVEHPEKPSEFVGYLKDRTPTSITAGWDMPKYGERFVVKIKKEDTTPVEHPVNEIEVGWYTTEYTFDTYYATKNASTGELSNPEPLQVGVDYVITVEVTNDKGTESTTFVTSLKTPPQNAIGHFSDYSAAGEDCPLNFIDTDFYFETTSSTLRIQVGDTVYIDEGYTTVMPEGSYRLREDGDRGYNFFTTRVDGNGVVTFIGTAYC